MKQLATYLFKFIFALKDFYCVISLDFMWRYENLESKIINNNPLKWRRVVVDIYRAVKRRGKYPPL